MILRRVIEHFRKQEWTAIAIDFVIVVAGVFVGLQVNNWNEARAEQRAERAFTETVRDAILADAENTRGYVETLDTNAAFGRKALATLNAPAGCDENCWPRIVEFFFASQWVNVLGDRTTFAEVQRTGLPRDVELKNAITRYYGLLDQLAAVTVQLPAYRERVRSIIPAGAQEHFWTACFRVSGRQQYYDAECPSPMIDAEARAIVNDLRADPELKGQLNFWLSTISVIRTTIVQQAEEAKSTAALIDDYLKATD